MSSGRRTYQSTLREERAAETRQWIRGAARRLFERKGFAGTTINEIATEAGVSAQTVYATFGTKGGLVGAMIEEIEESVDLTSWIAQMTSEPDPRATLRIFIEFNRTLFESGIDVLRALMSARGDPEVAAVGARGDEARRKATLLLADRFAAADALRPGLGPHDAAERLWLLTSAEQFINAIDGLGWSPDSYEEWLFELLERELFVPSDP